MKKNYLSFTDAKKVIFRDFSLLDKDLYIKSESERGTFQIMPIYSLGNFKKHDLEGYNTDLKSCGKELIIEINNNDIKKYDFTNVDILAYQKLENGTYYEVIENFEPRNIKLLELEVLKNKKNLFKKDYNIVVLLPSSIDNEKLFLSERHSVITIGDKLSERRKTLNRSRLGSDLYVKTNNEEIINNNQEYLVELEEEYKNIFQIKNKKYFFVKELTEEEKSFLTSTEVKVYNSLINNKNIIMLDLENNLNYNYDNPLELDRRYQIKIDDLNQIYEDHTDFLNNIVEVYNQEGTKLDKIDLANVLNQDYKTNRFKVS
ncbi:MAG: hypothetical protein PHF21_00100 [Bacilli bacterium]|nr:hypothetical protein [Bacilli bacterium]